MFFPIKRGDYLKEHIEVENTVIKKANKNRTSYITSSICFYYSDS